MSSSPNKNNNNLDTTSSSSSNGHDHNHKHTHKHHTEEYHYHSPVVPAEPSSMAAVEAEEVAGGGGGDADDDLEWEEWRPDQISFVHHMIAGSIAGLAEHVSLYPVDTIKTHLQCQRCGTSISSSWSSTMRMIQREGIFRLWRGVSAMFAGCVPAHAAYFSIFESTRRLVGADQPGHHPLGAAICGATASLSHDLLITPFDVVKQRMQLGYYRDVRHCMKEILRSEGIGAFYVALPTTMFMNLPYGSIVVAVNESMKKLLNPSGKYDIPSSMIAGCTAGAIAAAITTPMDVIKTKLQTQEMLPCGEQSADMCIKKRFTTTKVTAASSGSGGGATTTTSVVEEVIIPKINKVYGSTVRGVATASAAAASGSSSSGNGGGSSSNQVVNGGTPMSGLRTGIHWLQNNIRDVWSIVKKVAREEGVAGFYRGTVPRIVTQAPAVAISWTAYESMKSLLSYVTNDADSQPPRSR